MARLNFAHGTLQGHREDIQRIRTVAARLQRHCLIMAAWIIPGLVIAQGGEQHQMVLVVKSNKSFPDTLKDFKEEGSKSGWSLLNANNMARVLSERGFTLSPVVLGCLQRHV